MKTILEWLEEAKQHGYDWADAAIRNYDPNFSKDATARSLEDAINSAFVWEESPQGSGYWLGIVDELEGDNLSPISPVSPTSLETLTEALRKLNNAIEATRASYEEQLTEVKPTSLESLIEDLGKLNNALEDLAYNDTLKEPYRTQVYDATKASYEEQLSEVKEKIAKILGLKGDSSEELSMLKRDFDRQLSYIQVLEVENDGLSRELEAAKGKKLIGWVTSDANGYLWRWDNALRKLPAQWERKVGERLTTDQAIALCGRVPKWSDDEPIPVYEK